MGYQEAYLEALRLAAARGGTVEEVIEAAQKFHQFLCGGASDVHVRPRPAERYDYQKAE